MNHKPSFREKQELKRKCVLAAGLISDRFPGVTNIAFQLTYYQRTVDPVLMERTINFCPSSAALFRLDCLRDGCSKGGFDLTPVVCDLIKKRKRTAAGRIPCCGTRQPRDPGHATLGYRVNIEYRS